MIQSHLEGRFVEIIDAYVCNMCGNELENKNGMQEGLVEGADGSLIGDGVILTFSLCEPCLINLFKQFKHQPTVENEGRNGLEPGVARCEGCDQDCQRDCENK